MPSIPGPAPDVFSAREIARAAGVSTREVRRLIDAGEITSLDGRFTASAQAVAAVRAFRTGRTPPSDRSLFRPAPTGARSPGPALAASSALHAGLLGLILLITTWGVRPSALEPVKTSIPRLIFLATPGPGGGGGGGGLKQPAPARKAETKGVRPVRSPVPSRRLLARRDAPERRVPPPPVRPRPIERPADPPPPAVRTEPLPQVDAPVATIDADLRNTAGVLAQSAPASTSQGEGTGGGAGTGSGTGIGEGEGSGIGPGSGGGTGGGPYRPGAGITPPAILREVKPDYTEEARRRRVEGDVVVEVIVRRDGSVGTIKLIQSLGAGLDERAMDAVRQWRFSPAHRYGEPVDVVVEVAVEFKLR